MGQTDWQTDWPTNRQTDKVTCRVACTWLKNHRKNSHLILYCPMSEQANGRGSGFVLLSGFCPTVHWKGLAKNTLPRRLVEIGGEGNACLFSVQNVCFTISPLPRYPPEKKNKRKNPSWGPQNLTNRWHGHSKTRSGKILLKQIFKKISKSNYGQAIKDRAF